MGVMTRLLLLLWVSVTASTVVDLQKRIIGGRDCGPAERPYHVKLIGSNGTHRTLCGGSLISKRWILTAAHCWVPPGWTLTAYLGGHPNQANEVQMQITEHQIPTDSQNRDHDIMLLQLPNNTLIKPAPLPNCSNPLNINDTVEVAGYASMTMGPNNIRQLSRAPVLQCANTTVVNYQPYQTCTRGNGHFSYQHAIYYQSPGVDTSGGDSGGGVVFNGMIYGVHLFTVDSRLVCFAPAGFMDVCEFKRWINGIAGTAIP